MKGHKPTRHTGSPTGGHAYGTALHGLTLASIQQSDSLTATTETQTEVLTVTDSSIFPDGRSAASRRERSASNQPEATVETFL
jgi:hypothetical protein